MLIKFAEYCGFEISATFRSTAHGFMPIVFVGKHGENGLNERRILSPHPGHGFATQDKALAAGIELATAAINGRIANVDVSML